MARRREPDRIIGRYDEDGRPSPRGRRVIYVRGGVRRSETFSWPSEAGAFCRGLQAEIEGSATLTIAEAIERYIEDLRRAGMAPLTLRHRPQILLRFFDGGEDPVLSLTVKRVAALYRAQVDSGAAAATHHLLLRCAKAFLAWASGRRSRHGVPGASPPLLLPADPSLDVHPEGQAKQGKDQPRVDEAVRLIVACDRLALERRDPAAIAVLSLIYTGARLGEITTRQVRDLDAGASILWMPPSSRTKKRPPYRDIHEPLRSHLLALAEGRCPTDPLFPCGPHESHSGWLGRHLTRLCAAAGIPRKTG